MALLAGSRKQEIKDNLSLMIKAASGFDNFQLVLAGAPGISPAFYQDFLQGKDVKLVFGKTYELLNHASYALVTSGTATLETALFRVPQVVCYYTPVGKFISFMRKLVLSVKYISLVNLIAGRTVVQELVADTMTVENMRNELDRLIHDETYRLQMLEGYEEVSQKLGTTGAPQHAANLMIDYLLKKRSNISKSQTQG